MIKNLAKWGWYPALITALAVLSLIYQWPIEVVVPSLIVILAIGLVVAVIGARDKQLELASLRLRQLADYFDRRFMGTSSLSIFAIINSLFNIDNPKLWEWAHYYEFVQQFHEIAEGVEIPKETASQYSNFVMEYNAFVQDFRDTIADLRKVAKTGIDPPSVKLARELTKLT